MLLKQIESFDSNYLRGIAILTIMLHNYLHILDGAPGENEFSFSITTTYTYLHNLLYLPADFLKQTFLSKLSPSLVIMQCKYLYF
jgi:hypothetical protein